MPAVWQNMSPEQRRLVVRYIDELKGNSQSTDNIWTPQNLKELVKYAPLSQMNAICISYYFAKENLYVIDHVCSNVNGNFALIEEE